MDSWRYGGFYPELLDQEHQNYQYFSLSWVSLSGTDDRAFAQGEFVATSDELQSLLRALRSKDIKIVSIRNHMVGEHPQLLFVRFWEQGRAVDIVTALRYALNVQVGISAAPS